MEAIDGVYYLEPRLVFDAALVGHTREPKDHWPRTTNTLVAVYDYDRCVEAVMNWCNIDDVSACEHVDFNVTGAWIGEGTPMFTRQDDDEDASPL